MTEPSGVDASITQLIRMTVIQDDDGNVTAIEHDVVNEKSRPVAKFSSDVRSVLTKEGEEAKLDVAKVRGIIFSQLWETLVNSGKVVVS